MPAQGATIKRTGDTARYRRSKAERPLATPKSNRPWHGRDQRFLAELKRSINGTQVYVSGKHLSKYLCEFEYRWNAHHALHLMLDR